MPEFIRKPAADLSPTECFTCLQADVPMTLLREYISGAAWICDMCVAQLARVIGCSDPGVAEDLRTKILERDAHIEELEDQVEIEKTRQMQVISIEDARCMFGAESAAIIATPLLTPVSSPPRKRNASSK